MRLFGNFTNRMMETSVTEPVVGGPATVCAWSDRHACTVTAWDGTTLELTEDTATRVDAGGMSEAQRYEYEANPDGRRYRFRRDRTGAWRELDGNRMVKRGSGHGIAVGVRQSYHDFGF